MEEVEEVVEVLEAAKTVSGGEKKRLLANLQEKVDCECLCFCNISFATSLCDF